MNITEIKEYFNTRLQAILEHDELYTFLIVVLVGAASFGLGRASIESAVRETATNQTANLEASGASPAVVKPQVENQVILEEEEDTDTDVAGTSTLGKYVASKTGSKYHLPWCGGAKQIKEENKVWFETKEEAEAAGYEPAANCKGI